MTPVEKLARRFSRNLVNEIGVDKVREVVLLNFAEPDVNVCHSHDFCDANVLMDEAFVDCGYASPPILGEPHLDEFDGIGLWNKAWEKAKDAQFYLSKPPLVECLNCRRLIEVGPTEAMLCVTCAKRWGAR